MDDLWTVLLIAALYVIPAVWRRIISKSQMPLPEQETFPVVETDQEESRSILEECDIELPAQVIASHMEGSHDGVEDITSWQGKLREDTIITGVIFAEILQPPRAYRPFIRNRK